MDEGLVAGWNSGRVDKGEEVGDGRAEGASAVGDGGWAAASQSLMLMARACPSLKVHNWMFRM